MRHFTSNGTDQCQNGSSNFLTPYREQSRSNRIVVAYPRRAFSATKRIDHAPISVDQQAQRRKQTVIRDQFFPQKPSGSRLLFGLAKWVQPFHPASPRPSSLPGANLMVTHRLLSSLPISAAARQFWCHDHHWYERSGFFLWIQLAVHRQRHRIHYIMPLAVHSMPGLLTISSLSRFGSTLAGRQPGQVLRKYS